MARQVSSAKAYPDHSTEECTTHENAMEPNIIPHAKVLRGNFGSCTSILRYQIVGLVNQFKGTQVELTGIVLKYNRPGNRSLRIPARHSLPASARNKGPFALPP